MSRGSGSFIIPVVVVLAILLIVLPVSASNTTPTTTVATMQTTEVTPTTTVATTQTTEVTPTTTVAITQTTDATPATTVATTKTTVGVTKTVTVVTTANPTMSLTETGTTGSVTVHSSPIGASILIDGIYSGTTPGNVDGMAAGNHILRLTLSGFYDYEGSIYVVPGQENQGYGTLQPMSLVTSAPASTAIVPIIIATLTPAPTQNTGLLGNSGILVAIIGVITALIASGATIFTHVKPPKKE
jgi:hypothetical protein